MSTITKEQTRIGVVGIGRMGSNMAKRLNDCGWKVSALYDHKPEIAQELANEIGADAVSSLPEVTAKSDVILTVVTDDQSMREIFAENELLQNASGKFFINCATVSPEIQEEVYARCKASGNAALEACMASSITQAREGTLYLMCAGDENDYGRIESLLKDLSISKRFVGPAGTAAKVKALVNMVMNINTAGLAEGLGLGAALGIDLTLLREIFAQTGANSRVLETDGEDMQSREHSCYFSAAHAAKDSGIALELGKKAGLHLPLAEATRDQYEKMKTYGLGELDKSGIAELTFPNRHPG